MEGRAWRSYEEVYGHPPDFLVRYRVLTQEEGGRKSPVGHGMRFNWFYEGHDPITSGELWSIYPQFLDDNSQPYIDRFADQQGIASMWIPTPKLRTEHLDRLHVGVKGFMSEGPRPVVECEVIDIVALRSNPVE
jgi:hypothetical protein